MAFAFVEYPNKLLRWGLIDLGKHEAKTATSNLLRVLNAEHRWMRDSRAPIVVEQQPANGVCKTLSHCLQIYFETVDIEDGVEKTRPFHFMQANNKLRYDMESYNRIAPKNHSERKVVAMEVTEALLVPDSPFARYYHGQAHKQRTDLADAYIQGCRELQLISGDDRRKRAKAKREGRVEKRFMPSRDIEEPDFDVAAQRKKLRYTHDE
jgi:hypothetical protein